MLCEDGIYDSVYLDVIDNVNEEAISQRKNNKNREKSLSYKDAISTNSRHTFSKDDHALWIWLQTRNLARVYHYVRELGAKKVSDLAHLTDEDIDALRLSEHEKKSIAVVIA